MWWFNREGFPSCNTLWDSLFDLLQHRGLRSLLKFQWSESNLVCAFGLKSAGSLSCYLTIMEGNQYMGLRIFPSSVFCILFLINIYMLWRKRPEASPCLRADSLPFGFLCAPLKHFRAKTPPFKPYLEISNLISLEHIKYWQLVKPFACLVNLFCVGRTISQYLPDWLTHGSSKKSFWKNHFTPRKCLFICL